MKIEFDDLPRFRRTRPSWIVRDAGSVHFDHGRRPCCTFSLGDEAIQNIAGSKVLHDALRSQRPGNFSAGMIMSVLPNEIQPYRLRLIQPIILSRDHCRLLDRRDDKNDVDSSFPISFLRQFPY